MARPPHNVLQDLQESLAVVSEQVTHLTHMDNVFWQVQAIIRSNPKINTDDVFQEWIDFAYVASMVIGVRRLADPRRDVRSLRRLLEDMKRNSPSLTREWFLESQTDEHLQQLAGRWFDEIAGEAAPHISRAVINGKIQTLEDACDEVGVYANTIVAHQARTAPDTTPTYGDLRRVLAQAFRVFDWCSRALRSGGWSTPVPHIQSNWLEAFTIPWLADASRPPDYVHLDEIVNNGS